MDSGAGLYSQRTSDEPPITVELVQGRELRMCANSRLEEACRQRSLLSTPALLTTRRAPFAPRRGFAMPSACLDRTVTCSICARWRFAQP